MTDEKKTGETSETPYPGTLSWAASPIASSNRVAAVAHSLARAATTCT